MVIFIPKRSSGTLAEPIGVFLVRFGSAFFGIWGNRGGIFGGAGSFKVISVSAVRGDSVRWGLGAGALLFGSCQGVDKTRKGECSWMRYKGALQHIC